MSRRHLVTGGAGFIGSHLVDRLVADGHHVTVLDDLSSGDRAFLADSADAITFVDGDGRDPETLDGVLSGMDMVWHLAADPEVRRAEQDRDAHFALNVGLTAALLDAMQRHGVGRIAFTSTSTVYGEASVIPTPEDAPLHPISAYGAAKLECERRITEAAQEHGWDALLFRFANVVGPRSNHGVTYDFVHKLRNDPDRLEILGDGTQTKSYVHVADTVAGMVHAVTHAPPGVHPFNIGSLDAIPVTHIADIVADVMGLQPECTFTGGADVGGAGWKGDVKHMGLAVDRLRSLGWRPVMGSAEAVRDSAQWLVDHL